MALGSKDVAKSVKTLLVMLQSCKNQQVSMVLRNDTRVTGTIVRVDGSMNIELQNATIEQDAFYCTDGKIDSSGKDLPGREKNSNDGAEPNANIDPTGDSSTHEKPFVDNDCGDDFTRDKSSGHDSIIGSDHDGDDDDDNDDKCARQHNETYDYFIVKGSRIRHIDLPTDCDHIAGTKSEIERIRNRRKQWSKKDILKASW